MHIPTEILQAITREATAVPEAFDSSLDSILHDNRASVSAAIRKSLLTKTALSLVSILFHQIVEEFLYEIIVIERFHVIPHLVRLLQSWASSRSGRNKPRGHHCQRLEIHLGTRAVDYADEAWYEGGHVLWGLIPACPNVTILLCSVWRRKRAALTGPEVPHLTNPALWKNIASTYGPQIKRLEIYGLSIRMDRVEMMLRYCAKLEVCRLVHVRPFDGGETYDGDEPSMLGYSWIRKFCTVRDQTEGRPSGFFSEEAKRAFDKAKNATWPPYLRRPPYELPSLHTLHIDQFNSRINKFDMPNLQFLGMYHADKWPNEVLGHMSSTNWSKIAASLTHLSFGALNAIPLQFYLETFPNMTELVIHHIYKIRTSAPSTVVTTPHHSLSVIKYSCSLYSTDMSNDIEDLLSVVQSGMLPCLRRVLITRWKSNTVDGGLPWGKLRVLGVALTVRTVRPPGIYKVKGRYEFPDYRYD